VSNHFVDFRARCNVYRLKTLPGIKGLSFEGKYPIGQVAYDIVGCPVEVAMECMTPLIPNDAKASSMPLAVSHSETMRANRAVRTVPTRIGIDRATFLAIGCGV
jgi:uncharacterized protein (DUF608 family)